MLFLSVLAIAFLLYRSYQPLCEPCLEKAICASCMGKEQYLILYTAGAIEILILMRIIYLLMRHLMRK